MWHPRGGTITEHAQRRLTKLIGKLIRSQSRLRWSAVPAAPLISLALNMAVREIGTNMRISVVGTSMRKFSVAYPISPVLDHAESFHPCSLTETHYDLFSYEFENRSARSWQERLDDPIL